MIREQAWFIICIQHVEKHPVKICGSIGATSGVWQHIVILGTCMWFLEPAPIKTYNTGVILGSDFWYLMNKEINYRILINYAREDIAWKLFQNNVTIKESRIQIFYTAFMGGILVFWESWRNHVVNCEEMKLWTILGLNVKMKTEESKILPIMKVKWENTVLNCDKCEVRLSW